MLDHFWHGNWRGKLPDGDVHRLARTIVRPTGGIVRGKFPSRKNGRMIHYEGLLELDAIYLFEASPLIVRFREQPTKIRYPDEKRLRLYTPDFELVLATGEIVLIEIKPARRLASTEIRRTFNCIEEHMRRSSIRFAILTELAIRQEPRLKNLKWIYHCAARVPPTHAALDTALSRHIDKFPASIATRPIGDHGRDARRPGCAQTVGGLVPAACCGCICQGAPGDGTTAGTAPNTDTGASAVHAHAVGAVAHPKARYCSIHLW